MRRLRSDGGNHDNRDFRHCPAARCVELHGLNVTNDAGEAIGEIKDLVIAEGKLNGYIVSVGGFLGMGDHYVTVGPAAIQVTYLENDKKWTAV
ncbi:sporulation protein YlmC with PRC-barrel domain [Mycoplana sp. BE70]|nr:PRC-barrel domain-containing protein [Mycoplana sp. BE70]MDR6759764.1 sporulation protein YlmC with PRC-barrel domain [Mycoplana sp. BE70]